MSHLLVLVFALVWTVVQCSCPTMCRCRNFATDPSQNDFYTVASCYKIPRNITKELSHKLQEITFISVNKTSLEGMFDDLIYELPSLKRLSLRNTTFVSLNFTMLSNITYLDLSYNNLALLPNIGAGSHKIRVLDLSNNLFSVLLNCSFKKMDILEVLNISFNNVSVIEPGTFNGLSNLKCLDLSGNIIFTLTREVFLPIPSLQYLNLSSNHLDTLSELCFISLSKLQQLDVSWNNLRKVAPGCLELPSLARLLLAGNYNLGRSGDARILVSTGRKLQTVDASHIGLQQVPPSLTLSIRTLKLAGNKIKNINCGDLDSYPLLQMLDFTSNDISFIEEDALGRLDSLTMLFLSDNKIPEIPKSLPEKLEVLRIEQNELDRIGNGDLQGLTKLEVLLLSDNKIRIIEAKAFSQLTSLVTLDLSKNPVSVLQAGCLLGPISLQVLRLSGIELISPAKDVSFPLSAPEHLITLDLSNSPGMARQFLSDTAVLAASKQLQELDLSNTNLEEITPDLLHYLPQLRSLHLDGNKLNCSHLQWLASWMRKQDETEYRKIICANPPELWGVLLTDLQDEDSEFPQTTTTEAVKVTSLVTSHYTFTESFTKDVPAELNIHETNITRPNVWIHSTSKTNVDGTDIEENNAAQTSKKLISTSTTEKFSTKIKHISVQDGIQNNELYKRKINTTRINTKTTYTKVLDTPLSIRNNLKAINTPKIKSQSSYTNVMDFPTYHKRENAFREKSTTLFVDIVPNTIRHWNGTADELSSLDVKKKSFHPGMIILFIGVLGAVAIIVMFASKFTRKVPLQEDRDIEVSSLPSVTELW
ncbi:hypothetical protein HHI36_016667 [Cryptolaemus montrouzieri]|uniref:Uncharacterized protein n=1 Tax=Cryptolaemus montrouzieri TaxID=559131 RepID=A0ABD2NKF2_9CUCU